MNLLTASVVVLAMLMPFLAVTAGYVVLTQVVKRWYIHRFGTWL